MFYISHHIKHGIVTTCSERQRARGVNQVEEEVNPSVEVGFDNCRTSPKPDFSMNQGKPRMHLNLPCVLQIDIALAVLYCIK